MGYSVWQWKNIGVQVGLLVLSISLTILENEAFVCSKMKFLLPLRYLSHWTVLNQFWIHAQQVLNFHQILQEQITECKFLYQCTYKLLSFEITSFSLISRITLVGCIRVLCSLKVETVHANCSSPSGQSDPSADGARFSWTELGQDERPFHTDGFITLLIESLLDGGCVPGPERRILPGSLIFFARAPEQKHTRVCSREDCCLSTFFHTWTFMTRRETRQKPLVSKKLKWLFVSVRRGIQLMLAWLVKIGRKVNTIGSRNLWIFWKQKDQWQLREECHNRTCRWWQVVWLVPQNMRVCLCRILPSWWPLPSTTTRPGRSRTA